MSQVTADVPAGARRVTYADLAAFEIDPGQARGTVLLVAGFTGSKEDFSPLLPLLAEAGWRVVAVDQRGQHESPGTDEQAAYSLERLGADLLAVVDALGAPVHLVGHSFGGLVSRAAVLQRPEAFTDLVLLGSGPDRLVGGRADIVRFIRPLVEKGGVLALADAAAELAESDMARQPQPPEVQAFMRARHLANHPVALVEMADTLLAAPDRVDALRATGVPVLVAHGEGDDAWLPEAQRGMAERLGAAYEVVPEAQHSPAAENPEATAKALLAFWG
jgi:pimeloyl-ACP methyl ester carboxylesterase